MRLTTLASKTLHGPSQVDRQMLSLVRRAVLHHVIKQANSVEQPNLKKVHHSSPSPGVSYSHHSILGA